MRKALSRFDRWVIDASDRDQAKAELMMSVSARALPTMIFYDAAGAEVTRLVGCRSEGDYVAAARRCR